MDSSVAKETKSIITGLLTSTPLRCTIQQLCKDFRDTVGYHIPCRQLGFSNIEQYLLSIPDAVRIVGSGPSAEVQGVITAKSAHMNVLVAKQRKDNIPAHKRKNVKNFHTQNTSFSNKPKNAPKQNQTHNTSFSNGNNGAKQNNSTMCEDEYRSRIPKRVQNNLRKLIMRFPEGIWCTQLRAVYRNMFQEDLNYESYGFRSLIVMCADLPDIFQYIQPATNDFILCDKNKAIPSVNQNEVDEEHERNTYINTNLDWSLGSELIPSDVVQFLEVIPQISLADVRMGDSLQINIGEIYDIDTFWIFSKHGDLNIISKDFQTFFSKERNRYVIPQLFLQKGLYCTVFYDDKYHRCAIVELLPGKLNFAKVLFIDYGSVGEVCTKDIWYLPKKFGEIPSQAIRARLSSVKSNGDSTATLNKFKQLVRRAELIAEVTKVDTKDRLLDLYIANVTNVEEIFYVNDALVEKGYAEYC